MTSQPAGQTSSRPKHHRSGVDGSARGCLDNWSCPIEDLDEDFTFELWVQYYAYYVYYAWIRRPWPSLVGYFISKDNPKYWWHMSCTIEAGLLVNHCGWSKGSVMETENLSAIVCVWWHKMNVTICVMLMCVCKYVSWNMNWVQCHGKGKISTTMSVECYAAITSTKTLIVLILMYTL